MEGQVRKSNSQAEAQRSAAVPRTWKAGHSVTAPGSLQSVRSK